MRELILVALLILTCAAVVGAQPPAVVKDDTLDLWENVGPERLPLEMTTAGWLGLSLALLVTLGLLSVVWVWWTRPRQPRPVLPHERAMAELARIAASPAASAEQVRQQYFQLSHVLRQYVEEKLHLPAVEQTTPELATTLKAAEMLTPELKSTLIDLLRRADLVKFAGMAPTAVDRESWLDGARRFINATTSEAVTAPRPPGS